MGSGNRQGPAGRELVSLHSYGDDAIRMKVETRAGSVAGPA
ncbi:hypothetical protein [Methanoregula sp.]